MSIIVTLHVVTHKLQVLSGIVMDSFHFFLQFHCIGGGWGRNGLLFRAAVQEVDWQSKIMGDHQLGWCTPCTFMYSCSISHEHKWK